MDIPPSFDFAKETVTQLLTLATGVIGISVTFAKDVRSRITSTDRKLLFWSWALLLASVVFGIWTLMALTGSLAAGNLDPKAIYENNVKLPSILQIGAFVLGIG